MLAACVAASLTAAGCGGAPAEAPASPPVGGPAPSTSQATGPAPSTSRATGPAPASSAAGPATASPPAGGQPAPAAADTSGPYPVTEVVDGDTIKVSRAGRTLKVRLIGMDTPETRDPRKPVQCFGREAAAEARRLLDGRQVRLETDPSQDRYDRYGRLLAYVWLPGDPPVLVNELMIRLGYAHEYTYDLPYRYQQRFRAAQRVAEQRGAGLWNPATCAGDTARPAATGT